MCLVNECTSNVVGVWKERQVRCQRIKKAIKVMVKPFVDGALGTSISLVRRVDGLEIGGRNHPNYSLVMISQNTEKSPVDLRRLTVISTPVKYHQLMLVLKTLKKSNNNNNKKKNTVRTKKEEVNVLYIYQHIFWERKTRRKNKAMTWIDNKKAFDVVQQS